MSTSTCCATSTACSIHFPELFTPYAAERLGRQLEPGHDDLGVLHGVGPRLRRLRRVARRRGARAQAVVDGRAVPRRRPGDRQDSFCRASHPRRHSTRRDRDRSGGPRCDASLARPPRHRRRHDHPHPGQDRGAGSIRTRPPHVWRSTTGRTSSRHSSPPGVFGIVLDRWGSYRGDHPTAGDLRTSPTSSPGGRPRRDTIGPARRAGRRAHRPRRSGAPGGRDGRAGGDRALGAAVRRRLLHRARPGRGHVPQPARRRLVDGLPRGRHVAQQPRAVAARRPGPVHQARPLLGHGRRCGGDEHRRHRRRVARQPPHPRIRSALSERWPPPSCCSSTRAA